MNTESCKAERGERPDREGEFHFIDWGGSGPLAHFGHATGFCASTYTPLVERLRSRLHMVGMDDRGHGKTTAPADPEKLKNWDLFYRDLERFIERFGEPVIAMGHSRGAILSLLLAVKRPELIRALILIDPTLLPFAWMGPWYLAGKLNLTRFVSIAARAAQRKADWPDRDTILSVYRRKYPFRTWEREFLEGYISGGTARNGGGGIHLTCAPAWESRCFSTYPHDLWGFVKRIEQPTLVIYGAESDVFTAPAVKRFEKKVPKAVLRRVEGVGHFVPMERPDETAGAIVSFLEESGLI